MDDCTTFLLPLPIQTSHQTSCHLNMSIIHLRFSSRYMHSFFWRRGKSASPHVLIRTVSTFSTYIRITVSGLACTRQWLQGGLSGQSDWTVIMAQQAVGSACGIDASGAKSRGSAAKMDPSTNSSCGEPRTCSRRLSSSVWSLHNTY